MIDRSVRNFGADYIYSKAEYADFFSTSILLIFNSFISLGFVFYWQLSRGSLPFWLVYAYYFSWVGFGGRIMGAAYALAHKEVFGVFISDSMNMTISLIIFLAFIRVTIMDFTQSG